MPELGKYAFAVLSSYGVSVVLIIGLVVLSLHRSKKTKQQLSEVEARQGSNNG